ncbi:MAG: penicillin-binding protein [Ruminococcus sp.]|nr:penicillin-binding protein [Ruminococcus sp.]
MKKDQKPLYRMRQNTDRILSANSRSTSTSSGGEEKQKDATTIRVIICVILLIAIFGGFALRLFDWQIVHGDEYKELSAASTAHTVESDATRGEILDVNGKPLAVNETAYNIVINKVYAGDDNDLNLIIINLLNTLHECDEAYIDELPISYMDGGFVFDEGSEGDVEYIESPVMLDKEGLSADEIVDGLAERYHAKNIEDPFTKRSVVSVRYNMEKKGFSYEQVYVVADDVSSDTVAVVSERNQTVPAVEIRTVNERVIQNGDLIPHILGVVGKLDEEEYASHKDKGYALDDVIGKFGVEAAMEDYLRGEAGEKTIITDADGNIVGEEETVESKPGDTIYLTINSRIQEVAAYTIGKNIREAQRLGLEDVKKAKAANAKQQSKLGEDCVAGAAVMLDVRDNSVICAASYPNYDISRYYDPDYSEYLFSDESVPMFNRAFEGAFAPGSTFKPCVATAALQENIITTNTTIHCNGVYDYYKDYVVHCLGNHGDQKLESAMAHSCNCYFAEVGRRVGITTMYMYAEKLGLGSKTGLEVYESTGVLAGRDSTTWYEGNTVQAAIGQSDNAFTPVQLATYASTIANNGVRYRTHLVRKIMDYERDETVLYNDPEKPEIVAQTGVSQDNIDLVKEAMNAVTKTDSMRQMAGKYPIELGCKTGTAENAGSDHNVFICFAPYDDPEIALCVLFEHGGRSYLPQQAACDILDAYFYDKDVDDIKKNPWKF